jgi:DNA-binding beta-propeller fold protein YncE
MACRGGRLLDETVVVRAPAAIAAPAIAAPAIAALAIAACGSAPRAGRGAEPARSPPRTPAIAGREVPVGGSPEGIAVDSRAGIVAVATRRPNALALLDVHSGRVRRLVGLAGTARHLALAATGSSLLIPSEAMDRLIELDLRSWWHAQVAVGAHPHDAVAVDGRTFVADEFGHSVSVVEHGRVASTLRGFRQPGGVAAAGRNVAVVDTRTGKVFVTATGDGAVEIVVPRG